MGKWCNKKAKDMQAMRPDCGALHTILTLNYFPNNIQTVRRTAAGNHSYINTARLWL